MDDIRDRLMLLDTLEPPDQWTQIEAGGEPPRSEGPSPWRRLAIASVALSIAGAAGLFLWRAMDTSGTTATDDPVAGEVQTSWFRAQPPEGWSVVLPEGRRIGHGLMVAQFTSFEVDAPLCLGESSFPADGVLVRLTLGSESNYEESMVGPALDSSLRSPTVVDGAVIGFVDDCGVERKLLAKFFGPDGHVLMAHVLVGPSAGDGDVEAVEILLNSLAPTGHEPISTGLVDEQIRFAEGTAVGIGRWVMSVRRYADESERSLWLHIESAEHGWAVNLEPGDPFTWVMGGDWMPPQMVMGTAPTGAARVLLEIEGRSTLEGTLVPLPAGEFPDRIAYWVGPFRGVEITAEGSEFNPDATLVVLDAIGQELARHEFS
jgi:hypothetical protein